MKEKIDSPRAKGGRKKSVLNQPREITKLSPGRGGRDSNGKRGGGRPSSPKSIAKGGMIVSSASLHEREEKRGRALRRSGSSPSARSLQGGKGDCFNGGKRKKNTISAGKSKRGT